MTLNVRACTRLHVWNEREGGGGECMYVVPACVSVSEGGAW